MNWVVDAHPAPVPRPSPYGLTAAAEAAVRCAASRARPAIGAGLSMEPARRGLPVADPTTSHGGEIPVPASSPLGIDHLGAPEEEAGPRPCGAWCGRRGRPRVRGCRLWPGRLLGSGSGGDRRCRGLGCGNRRAGDGGVRCRCRRLRGVRRTSRLSRGPAWCGLRGGGRVDGRGRRLRLRLPFVCRTSGQQFPRQACRDDTDQYDPTRDAEGQLGLAALAASRPARALAAAARRRRPVGGVRLVAVTGTVSRSRVKAGGRAGVEVSIGQAGSVGLAARFGKGPCPVRLLGLIRLRLLVRVRGLEAPVVPVRSRVLVDRRLGHQWDAAPVEGVRPCRGVPGGYATVGMPTRRAHLRPIEIAPASNAVVHAVVRFLRSPPRPADGGTLLARRRPAHPGPSPGPSCTDAPLVRHYALPTPGLPGWSQGTRPFMATDR